jgi:type IV pilus assembly protein PilE
MQCQLKLTQSGAMNSSAKGFSLIELLIVMVVVAILAAIAYPSYQSQIMRTQRNAAKACLSQYAHFMERYYTSNLTYVGAAPELGCKDEGDLPLRYTFLADPLSLSRNTYTVSATPIGTQLRLDTQCAILRVDQTGTPTATGTAAATCW